MSADRTDAPMETMGQRHPTSRVLQRVVDEVNELKHGTKLAQARADYEQARNALEASALVTDEVLLERQRQDKRWGAQNHHPMQWLAILGEEVGEANRAAVEAHFAGYAATGDWSQYRAELIQVAAVAIAMVESLDRGRKAGTPSI